MFVLVNPTRQRLVKDGRAEGCILRGALMPGNGHSILIRGPGHCDIYMDGDIGNLFGDHHRPTSEISLEVGQHGFEVVERPRFRIVEKGVLRREELNHRVAVLRLRESHVGLR
jgi:hypothetical protein